MLIKLTKNILFHIVVDQCLDHCLLLEQNPKIEIVAPPTNAPKRPSDNGEIDDLNFHLSKRKKEFSTRNPSDVVYSSTSPSPTTEQMMSSMKTKLHF